jgi:hypothetical protein
LSQSNDVEGIGATVLFHNAFLGAEKELSMELMALTRLDWNTSKYSLSKPITLKFAERVGKVLGLIPQGEKIQHQYRFYM